MSRHSDSKDVNASRLLCTSLDLRAREGEAMMEEVGASCTSATSKKPESRLSTRWNGA